MPSPRDSRASSSAARPGDPPSKRGTPSSERGASAVSERGESSSTRERILDAAVGVLESSGLKKFAQPHIAKAAGIAQGHLTYYFPKRNDLLGALIGRAWTLIQEDLPQGLKAGLHERADEVRAKALRMIGRVVKNRARMRMLLGLIVASEEDPSLRKQVGDNVLLLRTFLAKFMGKSPKDPDVEIALAMFWGIGMQHLVLEGRRTDEETDVLLRRVEDWLAAMPESQTQGS
ncbi:MAG: TetR/AcrR family transcriptional regulator [Polyangiaceae bacterium]